ncbi:MAG: hypothetical protein JWM10_3002 [Myxococcaceae bacterium]|nr:hypothetical protein [Myxococcaceae bacterium]
MAAFEDLSGERFGGLVVVKRAENNRHGQAQWHCRCERGHDVVVAAQGLKQIRADELFGCKVCRYVSARESAAIVADYAAGLTCQEVAARRGVSPTTAMDIARRAGVGRSSGVAHRRYACDHHYFDTIDTEAKAYWLGFLAADGCVTGGKVCLGLKDSDRGHLEKWRAALGATHPIGQSTKEMDGRIFGTVYVYIASPELARALAPLGIVPRKSLTYTPPTLRPDLMRHFWRGMVDGDGCISLSRPSGRWSAELCGSRDVVEGFACWAATVTGTSARAHARRSIFKFRVADLKAVALLHALYDGATVYLDRKYALYLRAVAQNGGAKGHDRWGNPHPLVA